MINLLPIEHKKQIRSARSNVLLVRYNFILLGSLVFISIAIAISYFFLINTKSDAEQTIQDNISKEGAYSTVKAEANNFRTQTNDAKNVFDNQISFSKTILAISALIPQGAALNALTLDQTSFTQPVTFQFDVTGEDAAANLIRNFENSPQFTNVKKGSIAKGTGSYRYSLELTMSINKDVAK